MTRSIRSTYLLLAVLVLLLLLALLAWMTHPVLVHHFLTMWSSHSPVADGDFWSSH